MMIKRDKNNKFKKKGNQPATCRPAKGKLMSLFRAGWLFPEVKNLATLKQPAGERDMYMCGKGKYQGQLTGQKRFMNPDGYRDKARRM
ncbi:MAG: hypothetical protein LBK22_02875, partial [Tannerella sp.]|nr:hypothetical protein [Tannerella sp.]